MVAKSLSDWLDYLLSLHPKAVDLGLERVKRVYQDLCPNPPAPFVFIVAGTNGKGSSVAMLCAILQAAGYRVGQYTSPHILKFNERIQVNGQPVSDQQIIHSFERVERLRGKITLTFFEFSTLAALDCFGRAQLDCLVLEVGLGGRLDAVNVVDADASLICAIDLDHCDWLGHDRETIALEKAGVMRSGQISVCSDPNPPQTLVRHAQELSVNLALLGRDYHYEYAGQDKQAWCFVGKERLADLPAPGLKGEFQLQNAAGVLALLQAQSRFAVKRSDIEKGLVSAVNPGRLQQIDVDNQRWLLDVAHNPQAAGVLADYLASRPAQRIALFAALADKDIQPMVAQLKPYISHWVLVDLKVERAAGLTQLKQVLQKSGVDDVNIDVCDVMQAAVDKARQSGFEDVLVFGSFFTVSQAMEQISG